MQLQVSGKRDFQEQEGSACSGKLASQVSGHGIVLGGKCINKPLGSLKQWSAKCGPWTSSIGMTWELVRNADSQALPQICSLRLCRWANYQPCKVILMQV